MKALTSLSQLETKLSEAIQIVSSPLDASQATLNLNWSLWRRRF